MLLKLMLLIIAGGLTACKATKRSTLSEVMMPETEVQQYLQEKSLERIEPYLHQYYSEPLAFDLSDEKGNFFGAVVSLPPASDFAGLVLYSERESMEDLVLDPELIDRQGVVNGKTAGKCRFNVIAGKDRARLVTWSLHNYTEQLWGWVSEWNVYKTNSLFLKQFAGYALFIKQDTSTQFVMLITYFPTSISMAKDGAKANIQKTMIGMRDFFTAPAKIALRATKEKEWGSNFSKSCLGKAI